ncbi:MAG TPA: hypothetical protein VK191_15800 [Symbiobacteriaceae bacterium]|nr:hypothetical protein [Symbiobacteriaceae bacterium]
MSAEQHKNGCTVTVFQTVDVAAEIAVRPHVACGPAQVVCEESRVVPCDEDDHWGDRSLPLPGGCDKACTFWVIQRLCVAIPVTFDADATCTEKRVVCGPASTDPCPPKPHRADEDDCSGSSGGTSDSGSSGDESDCSDSLSDHND